MTAHGPEHVPLSGLAGLAEDADDAGSAGRDDVHAPDVARVTGLRSKIIATLGPASGDLACVRRLIEEGVRVFRINFSHGTFEEFERLVRVVREAESRVAVAGNATVGILGDLCGPKIRLGPVPDGGLDLSVGDRVQFTETPVADPALRASFTTTLPDLIGQVRIGDRLLIDDGAVRMLVVQCRHGAHGTALIGHVTMAGRVASGKGINLPDTSLKVDAITEDDWKCVQWAINHDIDMLALSFVRSAREVRHLQEALGKMGRSMPVIAKIEKPQALDDLERIVEAADAVMVARGDLGVEMDVTAVPLIQKRIVAEARRRGRPVIVATQMLQSMINAPMPTRAEVSDVAGAIFDQVDAVMLSGETAVGCYPIRTAHLMARTIRSAEGRPDVTGLRPTSPSAAVRAQGPRRPAALAQGVRLIAADIGAQLVVTWSQRGGGARYLAQTRLSVPILAATCDATALREMTLLYGVQPILLDRPDSVEAFVEAMENIIGRYRWLERGDPYLLVSSEPIGVPGLTNSLSIRYFGGVCRLPES